MTYRAKVFTYRPNKFSAFHVLYIGNAARCWRFIDYSTGVQADNHSNAATRKLLMIVNAMMLSGLQPTAQFVGPSKNGYRQIKMMDLLPYIRGTRK